MKWFILLGAGLMMSAIGARAQQPDVTQLVVHYKFSHMPDTANRSILYRENMVLLVGKHAGVYKSGEEHRSRGEYYQFPNEKKVVSKEAILMDSFLVTEEFTIPWQITRDTATF